jgi:chorismate mutase/prephenate dehydratase
MMRPAKALRQAALSVSDEVQNGGSAVSITDIKPEVLGAAASGALIALRHQIDALDDRLHDLLMERAAIIERVKHEGGKTGALIRPGREAAILRRLLGRHHGALPPHAILRIWRELFSAALMIEGGLTIAVADGTHLEMPALAREHFGPLTPLRRHATPAQALADLAQGTAQVAVLPLPSPADDTGASWWIGLMQGAALTQAASRLSIIARLPFWGNRVEGTPQIGAYAVAAIEPDPSGADRSLIGLETDADASTGRINVALVEAGFTTQALLQHRPSRQETAYALAEVDGLVARDDSRLAAIRGVTAQGSATRPQILGAYAIPVASVSEGA